MTLSPLSKQLHFFFFYETQIFNLKGTGIVIPVTYYLVSIVGIVLYE